MTILSKDTPIRAKWWGTFSTQSSINKPYLLICGAENSNMITERLMHLDCVTLSCDVVENVTEAQRSDFIGFCGFAVKIDVELTI